MSAVLEIISSYGLVAVAVAAFGFLIRYMLIGFKEHLATMQSSWSKESMMLYDSIKLVHDDLRAHILKEEPKMDEIFNEVSAVRGALMEHVYDDSIHGRE